MCVELSSWRRRRGAVVRRRPGCCRRRPWSRPSGRPSLSTDCRCRRRCASVATVVWCRRRRRLLLVGVAWRVVDDDRPAAAAAAGVGLVAAIVADADEQAATVATAGAGAAAVAAGHVVVLDDGPSLSVMTSPPAGCCEVSRDPRCRCPAPTMTCEWLPAIDVAGVGVVVVADDVAVALDAGGVDVTGGAGVDDAAVGGGVAGLVAEGDVAEAEVERALLRVRPRGLVRAARCRCCWRARCRCGWRSRSAGANVRLRARTARRCCGSRRPRCCRPWTGSPPPSTRPAGAAVAATAGELRGADVRQAGVAQRAARGRSTKSSRPRRGCGTGRGCSR